MCVLCDVHGQRICTNNKKQNKISRQPSRAKRPKKKATKPRKNKSTTSDPILRLIADPCNAPLVPFYGGQSGYLSRTAQNYSLQQVLGTGSTIGTNGYVVWFPQYHCDPVDGNVVNFYCYATTGVGGPGLAGSLWNGTSTSGVATAATAYAGNQLAHIFDPAYAFLRNGIAEDARTLSACLQVIYQGTTSASQGMFYPLTNIPLDSVFNGGGNPGTIPSVNQILRYAGTGQRVTDRFEVRFTPDQVSMQFQDALYGPLLRTSNTTAPSGDGAIARTAQPLGFGFAFTNLGVASDYQMFATKNYEWRPKMNVGLTASTSNQNIADPTFVQRAVRTLDATNPHWRTQAMKTSADILISGLQSLVLSGRSTFRSNNAIMM